MPLALLVLNAGSSSLKFSFFTVAGQQELLRIIYGQAEQLTSQPRFMIKADMGNILFDQAYTATLIEPRTWALTTLLTWLADNLPDHTLIAVGHRVLHGGERFIEPVMIDLDVIQALTDLIPLGPLHQPHNISPMRLLLEQQPRLLQVACFDTAFHATLPFVASSYALPADIAPVALKRYGFHGLSYEYISQVLPNYLGETAKAKIIVAHLGFGASLCALANQQSIATTMGFTALEGVPMGTRCGSLDPGILLYLMAEQDMDIDALYDLLYYRSGLLGISGISGDVRTLLASPSPAAKQALDLFCYRVQREIGSLAAALGGLDGLVFTGGIGEHAAGIRAQICQQAGWLGVEIDEPANQQNLPCISAPASKIAVSVIPTNEELVIAQHTWRLAQQES